jgi:hypothetical protein
MPGSWEPNPAYLSQLTARIRRSEYRNTGWSEWDMGGCGVVSEVLDVRYGWERSGGCYVMNPYADGSETETRHIAHYWNILPDGRILDATADQFHDSGEDELFGSATIGRVRITAGADPRYDALCEGNVCDPA